MTFAPGIGPHGLVQAGLVGQLRGWRLAAAEASFESRLPTGLHYGLAFRKVPGFGTSLHFGQIMEDRLLGARGRWVEHVADVWDAAPVSVRFPLQFKSNRWECLLYFLAAQYISGLKHEVLLTKNTLCYQRNLGSRGVS